MIKTLRITSIIAVVLAVVCFVFPAIFGVRGDKQIEQLLNSPGAIEEFKQARGDKIEDRRHEISPLVKQAETFALYLNPPVSMPQAESPVSNGRPRPKASVTPKFKLVGTSLNVLHPERSLALIDEPGKGYHWIRQADKVGHLIMEQVKDGLVVVRDGQNTFELIAERPEKISLLKTNSLSDGRITGDDFPEMDAEEEAAFIEEAEAAREKIFAELNAMQAESETLPIDFDADGAGSVPESEEVAAERKIAAPANSETMRISAREARKLGRLGRRLRNVQRQPNRVENDIAKSDTNGASHPQADFIEPNPNSPNFDENIPG
ncbi:MAG: hypothetical protein PHY02_00420 [Phycisphaerae bacterium]|nr:hypothetical protein [Phycisphaerae bacterium]